MQSCKKEEAGIKADGRVRRMNKVNRLLFDIICIIAIVLLPYFALEFIGIVDYVKENMYDGE